MEEIIINIGNTYQEAKKIYDCLGTILTIIVSYRIIYWIIGFFMTRKFKPALNKHRYAILIPARNEEAVIGNLLDSINKQDYPSNLITVFVVADNCSDDTKRISLAHNAICYERHDKNNQTKGYALKYLCERIEEDYGTNSFEGYFVFDADNLLKKDYITKMNDAFDAGERIVCSYRNTKNINESALASTYAIHWLRSIRTNHRPRSVLRLATNIQGTGFLFSNEIIKNGWKYTSITEDRAFTADAVANGYSITYQNDAIFYDEQPVNLQVSLRQRRRWARGHLEAFIETGPSLFINIFFGKLFLKNKWQKETIKQKKTCQSLLLSILESIRHRVASYDTLMQLIPISLINLLRFLIVTVIIYSCFCYQNGINNVNLFATQSLIGRFLTDLIGTNINIEPSFLALLMSIVISCWLRLFYRLTKYFENIFIAVYIFIVERKRLVKIPLRKKILYCFTWPTFDIIGRFATYLAVFKKVTWKPIPHQSKITIEDLN